MPGVKVLDFITDLLPSGAGSEMDGNKGSSFANIVAPVTNMTNTSANEITVKQELESDRQQKEYEAKQKQSERTKAYTPNR